MSAYIEGKITLDDGSVSQFSLDLEGGWSQWGAPTERLGRSVDIIEGMSKGITDAELSDGEDESIEYEDDTEYSYGEHELGLR